VVPDAADRLARRYHRLATQELHGYCDVYERIALAIVDDPEVLGLFASLVDRVNERSLGVLGFAAVHDLVLADPDEPLAAVYASGEGDPWPAFRDLVTRRFDDIAHTMTTRTVQTNEVGRTAVLVPALSEAAHRVDHRPLALIEIGPSAGLNLLLDRYRIAYDDGRRYGPEDATVALDCRLLGDHRPPLVDDLHLADRRGVDLAPLDANDPDDARWLRACLWPGITERAERLAAAVTVAQAHPPLLVRGDAVAVLGSLIDSVADDVVPVVMATWALAYLHPEGRAAIGDSLATAGAHRDVIAITAEYPAMTPWVPVPDDGPPVQADQGATLLGFGHWSPAGNTAGPLGWTHAHGRWLQWLGVTTT
jgi:hypothetical protein